MTHVSLNDFKAKLTEHFDRIEAEGSEIVVTRPDHAPMVVMTLAELESLRETLHLLSSPANAEHLRQSLAELETGKGRERQLLDL